MADFIFLMHDDCEADDNAWEPYLRRLQEIGCFQGGSVIGDGVCARKSGPPAPITTHVVGFMRVNAHSLEQAKTLLAGNPVFEAGGTVEIRELPRAN